MDRYIVKPGMNAADLGELDVVCFDTNTHITSIYPPVVCDYKKIAEIIDMADREEIEIRISGDSFETDCKDILTWIDGQSNCLSDLL